MYNAIKRSLTIVFIVLLLFLFTVPALYLDRLTEDLDDRCIKVLNGLDAGEDPAAGLVELRSAFDESADTLRLFLDHGVVDAVSAAVHGLVPLDDPADVKSGVEALRAELQQLAAIERLDFHTLF